MKSLLASFPFSNGLGTSLLLSRVKNLLIGNGRTYSIPLLQTKTADTAHTGIFGSDTRPLSRFLGGAWGRGYQASYIDIWVHLMYPFYIRCSLYIESVICMYTDYCRVLLLYTRWSHNSTHDTIYIYTRLH